LIGKKKRKKKKEKPWFVKERNNRLSKSPTKGRKKLCNQEHLIRFLKGGGGKGKKKKGGPKNAERLSLGADGCFFLSGKTRQQKKRQSNRTKGEVKKPQSWDKKIGAEEVSREGKGEETGKKMVTKPKTEVSR